MNQPDMYQLGLPGHPEPEGPGDDHSRIDNDPEQARFHNFQGLGKFRADLGIGVIDEQPRQIEHAGHPSNDRNDVDRLDPVIGIVAQVKYYQDRGDYCSGQPDCGPGGRGS